MMKRGHKYSILFLCILFLSMSPAIAETGSCMTDSGSTYCGQKTPNGCYCDKNCVSYQDCCSDYESVCKSNIISGMVAGEEKVGCLDSDGGQNYYQQGTVNSGGTTATDFCWNYGDYDSSQYGSCEGNLLGCVLVEHSCKNGQQYKEKYQCPNGCKDGACVTTTTISTKPQCKYNYNCPQIKCIKAPCPQYKCVNGQCVTGDPQPTISEEVKCVFEGFTTAQTCSSSTGQSCTGSLGACTVTVFGKKGEQVTWKSSCGGYAYTTMDGQAEYANFKCAICGNKICDDSEKQCTVCPQCIPGPLCPPCNPTCTTTCPQDCQGAVKQITKSDVIAWINNNCADITPVKSAGSTGYVSKIFTKNEYWRD